MVIYVIRCGRLFVCSNFGSKFLCVLGEIELLTELMEMGLVQRPTSNNTNKHVCFTWFQIGNPFQQIMRLGI